MGTPGVGNTCRASHPHGVSGIRVYADANDQWVRSRTIWNQHAYHVTHISEEGVVPQTSMWDKNWEQPELNNFRQNVPGDPNGNAVPDSTAGASVFDECLGGVATLTVDVCNRGAAPQGAGIVVGFYVAGVKICETTTSGPLAPEQCESVSCEWTEPPGPARTRSMSTWWRTTAALPRSATKRTTTASCRTCGASPRSEGARTAGYAKETSEPRAA